MGFVIGWRVGLVVTLGGELGRLATGGPAIGRRQAWSVSRLVVLRAGTIPGPG
jgi:hypothetical protein